MATEESQAVVCSPCHVCESLRPMMEKVSTHIKSMQNSPPRTNEEEGLRDDLDRIFKSLYTAIDEREAEMMTAVDEKCSKSESNSDLEAVLTHLENTKMYCDKALLFTTKTELLSLTGKIHARAEEVLNIPDPVEQPQKEDIMFKGNGMPSLVAEMADFGKIFNDKDVDAAIMDMSFPQEQTGVDVDVIDNLLKVSAPKEDPNAPKEDPTAPKEDPEPVNPDLITAVVNNTLNSSPNNSPNSSPNNSTNKEKDKEDAAAQIRKDGEMACVLLGLQDKAKEAQDAQAANDAANDPALIIDDRRSSIPQGGPQQSNGPISPDNIAPTRSADPRGEPIVNGQPNNLYPNDPYNRERTPSPYGQDPNRSASPYGSNPDRSSSPYPNSSPYDNSRGRSPYGDNRDGAPSQYDPNRDRSPSRYGADPHRPAYGHPGDRYPNNSNQGYPPRDQSGYPYNSNQGYPPRDQSGYPYNGNQGYPPRDQSGYPNNSSQGYPPSQNGGPDPANQAPQEKSTLLGMANSQPPPANNPGASALAFFIHSNYNDMPDEDTPATKETMTYKVELDKQSDNDAILVITPKKYAPDHNIKCAHMMFDKATVFEDNTVTYDGKLLNEFPLMPLPDNSWRFKNYKGALSTRPFDSTGMSYLEFWTDIEIKQIHEGRSLIFEAAIADRDVIDLQHKAEGQANGWGVSLSHCLDHKGLCRRTWGAGEALSHFPNTLPNTPGSRSSLKFGFLLMQKQQKLIVIDCNEEKVLMTANNVRITKPLWPVFGVYNTELSKVEASLVTSTKLNINRNIAWLILQNL